MSILHSRRFKWIFGILLLLLMMITAYSWTLATEMRSMINGYITTVLRPAASPPAESLFQTDIRQLPAPVQRYFRFAFPGSVRQLKAAGIKTEGEFRRPGSATWEPAQTTQYISGIRPEFIFYGDTEMPGGIWATMMDSYIRGDMHMQARLLSAFTILEKRSDALLDDISMMRYVIEGPLLPTNLLPGEHLRWEAISNSQARAVVFRNGKRIGAYRVTFAEDGRIVRFDAEDTPADALDINKVHGAGEVALRSDYRLVDGVMIPHQFEIARRSEGKIYPFLRGHVTKIHFDLKERF